VRVGSSELRAYNRNTLRKRRFIAERDSGTMQARPMPSCGVCLSVCVCVCERVCVCVTFVHSIKANKHIFKIVSLSGSHTILVFLQNGMTILRRNSPNEGVECRWVGRNRDSEPLFSFTACCEASSRKCNMKPK